MTPTSLPDRGFSLSWQDIRIIGMSGPSKSRLGACKIDQICVGLIQ
jgi:hypothetical protein